MPITQDRFLEVLDAASSLVDLTHNIRRQARQNPSIIADANVVLERTTDNAARGIIKEFLESFNIIQSLLSDNEEIIGVLGAKIQAEQQYFKRVGRSNDRAAFYQRQKRSLIRAGRQGTYDQLRVDRENAKNREKELYPEEQEVTQSEAPPIISPVEPIDSESLSDRFAKLAKEEAEAKLANARTIAKATSTRQQPTAAPQIQLKPNSKHIPTEAGIGYDKDVISTSVPSLEELNAEGTSTPDKDLF